MDRDHIEKRCHHHGLLVRDIRRQDDVLVLVPESLDVIPPAARLQVLADELRADGDFKHVTLGLEDDVQAVDR